MAVYILDPPFRDNPGFFRQIPKLLLSVNTGLKIKNKLRNKVENFKK